ncbi:MAG TPA: DNA polymerase IV [Pseudogracilibacillus sp.]|nr:DNA polymerase IV [Pseudogracilibacillus sp.]
MDYSQYPRHDVLCVDMRSFYASVEAVKRGLNPNEALLAVVGDLSRPGSIVLATSPALKKKYNLQNVSRFFELPKDPAIHLVEANMADYVQASIEITKLLYRFAPQEAIHQYSVDEVWVTVDGLEKLFGTRWQIAEKIKRAIENELGLPSAIGIGDNKFLAKVVLDLHAKRAENGIAECKYEDVPRLLWPFPVEKIWGIGSRLKRHLHRLGITTLGQLASFPLNQLKERFGIMGEQLYWHAWGVDLSPVFGNFLKQEQKSFGHGISLLRDYNAEEVPAVLLDLCEETCRRARTAKQVGRTIHLSVRYSKKTGSGFSRSTSIEIPTNITMEMYKICLYLFRTHYDGSSKIRKVSVALTNLTEDEKTQLDLFTKRTKQKDLGYTMDLIRERFGADALLRATSYTEAGINLERSKKIGGHWANSQEKYK